MRAAHRLSCDANALSHLAVGRAVALAPELAGDVEVRRENVWVGGAAHAGPGMPVRQPPERVDCGAGVCGSLGARRRRAEAAERLPVELGDVSPRGSLALPRQDLLDLLPAD